MSNWLQRQARDNDCIEKGIEKGIDGLAKTLIAMGVVDNTKISEAVDVLKKKRF